MIKQITVKSAKKLEFSEQIARTVSICTKLLSNGDPLNANECKLGD